MENFVLSEILAIINLREDLEFPWNLIGDQETVFVIIYVILSGIVAWMQSTLTLKAKEKTLESLSVEH